MKRSMCTVGVGVIAVGLLTAATPYSAVARPTPFVRAGAVTLAEQQRVADYWTPERMRAATPMDLLTVGSTAGLSDVRRGAPATVGATPTINRTMRSGTASFPSQGSPWTGGGAIVHTTGRAFFTRGGNHACSADAVTSANKSVILLAGHCVKLQNAWSSNLIFVPAYDDGKAPYGKWPARTLMATPQWVDKEDTLFDVAAAIMNPLDGKLLTDVVGGQGVAFNQSRKLDQYSFGYPAAKPYDGKKLIYCSGPPFYESFPPRGLMGLACDMNQGASGGPWFVQFSEETGTGLQNSVSTLKRFGMPKLFGPYFGTDVQNLYNAAQAA